MSPKLRDPYTEKKDKLVPGPDKYTLNKSLNRTAPSFGFGTSIRNERKYSPTVDPGAYDPRY